MATKQKTAMQIAIEREQAILDKAWSNRKSSPEDEEYYDKFIDQQNLRIFDLKKLRDEVEKPLLIQTYTDAHVQGRMNSGKQSGEEWYNQQFEQ